MRFVICKFQNLLSKIELLWLKASSKIVSLWRCTFILAILTMLENNFCYVFRKTPQMLRVFPLVVHIFYFWEAATSRRKTCQGNSVVPEPKICMTYQKNLSGMTCVRRCILVMQSPGVKFPFFLASFRKRRVSVASELQRSNADSLFDFRRRIHSEFVSQDHHICLLTVAPISDHPRLSFGLI
jgi:hypothetical protein